MPRTTGRHAARRTGLPAALLRTRGLVVPAGVVLACSLVWQSSYAAFTASTSNTANAWSAGTVNISDDDLGIAMFRSNDASGQDLEPGKPSAKCIRVSYTGNSDVHVRMYAQNVSGTLAGYLKIKVEVSPSVCASFDTGAVTLYNDDTTAKTLSAFGTTHANFANGAVATNITGAWSPTAPEARSYRITTTVVGDNAARGTTAAADFVWEAQTPL